MKRQTGIPIGLLFIIALFMILAAFRRVGAQEGEVYSWLREGCIELVDATHYRIYFGYESNGVETYAVTLENTTGGAAFITTPATFTTEAGIFDNIWYLELNSIDSGSVFYVVFENAVTRHRKPINTGYETYCPQTLSTPAPQMPPDAQNGLLWAWDSASGSYYSYTPQTGGIVPLPPRMGE